MKCITLVVISIVLTASCAVAQSQPKPTDPCSMMSNAEAAAIIGEIKGEPVSKDGLRGRKCTYDNISGAWVSIEVYSADAYWDSTKNSANDPQPLTSLGDAAFTAKRGDTRQLFVNVDD